MVILVIVMIFILILMIAMFYRNNMIENFEYNYRTVDFLPYDTKYFKKNRDIPQVPLMPGYEEIDYINQKDKYLVFPSTDKTHNKFCSKNPLCYPCPGWKFLDGPMCV